jgi:hypothetical protein
MRIIFSIVQVSGMSNHLYKTKKTKLCGLSLQANYIDRVAAACRQS